MKNYKVLYWFHLSNAIEVEANTEDEAEEKVRQMIEKGIIGNLNEMDIGDAGIETIV